MLTKKISAFIARYVHGLVSCLYVFTIGIFSSRGRFYLYKICALFNYYKTSNQPLIPKVNLSDLIPEDFAIFIPRPFAKEGNVATIELVTLAKLIQFSKPLAIFEIGTFDGKTALNMAANALAEAKLFTLDLPKDKLNLVKLPLVFGDTRYINKETIGAEYKLTPYEKKIAQLYGDSAQFDFTPYYNTIDFVLIDGSHSYEYVLNDSKIALKLLRNGKGIILWHDYDSELWSGVTRALNELYSQGSDFKRLKHINGTSFVCFMS